jgi:hypothetical protein
MTLKLSGADKNATDSCVPGRMSRAALATQWQPPFRQHLFGFGLAQSGAQGFVLGCQERRRRLARRDRGLAGANRSALVAS